MGRGTVSMRVAFVLRSTEVQPFVPAICVRTEELVSKIQPFSFLTVSPPPQNKHQPQKSTTTKRPLPTKQHKTPPSPFICLVYVCVWVAWYQPRYTTAATTSYMAIWLRSHSTPSAGEECLLFFYPRTISGLSNHLVGPPLNTWTLFSPFREGGGGGGGVQVYYVS